MSHAKTCPICNGNGYIHKYGFTGKRTASAENETICHGCNGQGWVTIPEVIPTFNMGWEPPAWNPPDTAATAGIITVNDVTIHGYT